MKPTIRINQLSIRVPRGSVPNASAIAQGIVHQVALKTGLPVIGNVEEALTSRVANALRKRGY